MTCSLDICFIPILQYWSVLLFHNAQTHLWWVFAYLIEVSDASVTKKAIDTDVRILSVLNEHVNIPKDKNKCVKQI